jgi:hypothetical protein
VANIDVINDLHSEPDTDTLLTFSSTGVNGIAAGAYKIKLFYRKNSDTLWLPVLNVGDFVNEAVIVFEGDVSVETDSINGLTATSVNVYGSLSEGCANITAMGFKWKKVADSKYNTVTIQDSLFQYAFITLEPILLIMLWLLLLPIPAILTERIMGKRLLLKAYLYIFLPSR